MLRQVKVGCLVVACGLAAVGVLCCSGKSGSESGATSKKAKVNPEPRSTPHRREEPRPRPKSDGEIMLEASTLCEAIALARPKMSDERDNLSPGAILLAS